MNVEKKLKSLGFKKHYPLREEYSSNLRDYILCDDIEETKTFNGKKINILKKHSKKTSFYYKDISYNGLYIKKTCDIIEIIWVVDSASNLIKSKIIPKNITSLTDIITNFPKTISRDLLITLLLK